MNARYEGDGSIAGVTDLFEAVMTELTDSFTFNEVTAVQTAGDGSDIFLDVPGSTLVGFTWGSDPATDENNAVQLRFQGRSGSGRRVSFSVFGYVGSTSNYRLTAAEDAHVAAAVALLQAGDGSFCAIDGNIPTWKNYANVKANDHWVKEARNG